jgi:leader peptidase (prepilin peptidase)/N-methyltransferase
MLRWWMNIPILSYIFLGGRCYYCKAKISPRYPLNELLSGLFCGGLFYLYGMHSIPVFLFYYILAALSIIMFFIDLDFWLILDEITIPFTMVGIIGSLFIPLRYFEPIPVISRIFNDPALSFFGGLLKHVPVWLNPYSFILSITGALFGLAAFWAIAVIGSFLAKREAMGGGDLKFAMLMGAFLGPEKAFFAFIAAVFLGTAFMLPGLLIKRKTGKDQVPFGCFLAVSSVITVFAGEKLILLYIRLMGL